MTNISFLYFLWDHFNIAEDYANIDVNTNQYNSTAICNKGNWFFINSDFTRVKEIYLEDIGTQLDCVQAIYNIRLDILRLDIPEESSQAFEKLLKVLPNDVFVVYHIANYMISRTN